MLGIVVNTVVEWIGLWDYRLYGALYGALYGDAVIMSCVVPC